MLITIFITVLYNTCEYIILLQTYFLIEPRSVGSINKCFFLSQTSSVVNYFTSSPFSTGSVLNHISLPSVFEPQRRHIWKLFHLWLRLITFEGRSAHFAYQVHKRGHKTPIIIITSSPFKLQIICPETKKALLE